MHFWPENDIFSKKLFYSKLISDENYIICTCQKIHFQKKNHEFAIFTKFYQDILFFQYPHFPEYKQTIVDCSMKLRWHWEYRELLPEPAQDQHQNAENTSQDIKQVSQAGTALPPQCLASESWQTWSHISETKDYFHPYLESQKRRTSLTKTIFTLMIFLSIKRSQSNFKKNIRILSVWLHIFLFGWACLF